MGFLSKVWKGIKKTFKKIFKPIKKVFKSVGKFMGKIGIVGQIAMSFILPGIGSALSGAFSNVVGGLMGGALGPAGKAAGWVLGKAGEFAQMASAGFKTVTGAVTDFIGTTGKYVGGKLGFTKEMTLKQAFGAEGWGGRLTDSFSKFGDAAGELFDTDVKGTFLKGPTEMKEIYGKTDEQFKIDVDSDIDYATSYEAPGSDLYKGPSLKSIEGKTSLDVGADIDYATGIKTGSVVDSTVSSETSRAGQSLLSRGLKKLTGEETFEEALRAAPGKARDYAFQKVAQAPGDLVATEFKQGLSKAIGLGPEEYVSKPAWGSQPFQQYYGGNSMAFQQARTESLDVFTPFQNHVLNSPLLQSDPQGSWLGASFWERELKTRMAQ